MKQRIHNALYALIKNGKFYRYTVDSKTGQMTVDTTKTAVPTGVVVHESRAAFKPAEHYRRSYGGSELSSWEFAARVTFSGHALCDDFVEALADTGIEIPPIVGMPDQKRVLARLTSASYDHGPEQDPAQGTVVEFLFEIETKLLRK